MDWKDGLKTFQVGRLSSTVARELFHDDLPLIPAKALKEDFESRSELAHILSTQYMAEFGVHQSKGV